LIPIRRGNLKRSVVVQTVTSVSDGGGGYNDTVTDYHKCRAAVWPLSAKEILNNGQMEMKLTHKFRIDYKSGITPDMTIAYDSRDFEIVSIINVDEMDRILDFLCTEIIQ